MDHNELTNVVGTPAPHKFTYEEASALNKLTQQGEFFFRGETDADEGMTHPVLMHCVRTNDDFDTEGCSDAEVWLDVIAKAIVDGRIEYEVGGVVQNVQD